MFERALSYGMYVNKGRALPDVRDGLKPVQRRILYSMDEIGARAGRPYVKSATVIGQVIGHYHPHGDTAVYDAMVRLAQDFSLNVPLVDGQGNYGSVGPKEYSDPPAAYRYTEARLTPAATDWLTRHAARDRRVPPQLLGAQAGAVRPAGVVPEPARQRLEGHRLVAGLRHPDAQPGRGVRGRDRAGREPRRDARRPARRDARPRLPDRRHRRRPGGAARRLRPRPGHVPAAGQVPHRAAARKPAGDRRHRAAVRRVARPDRVRGRARGPGREDHRRHRDAEEPVRPQRAARADPVQARRQRDEADRRPDAAHQPARHDRHQPDGGRRRRAAPARPARDRRPVRLVPLRGGHEASGARAQRAAARAAPAGGAAGGARCDRRGDPHRAQRRG